MRESLRPHWYRVIWELGRLRAYYCRATARCEKVIIAWTALGDVLRLRIADEKAAFEYEREKATLMCAWDECMYHTQRPLVTTRACKGCGEVRYCSRECQVRDWKQGHRNHCKRLKTGK
ncbi:hypothetical protein PENSPDRAFT_234920 [Peniophora sp. CONT]|nr:hypothetical protein PENSPDRAFT_234920 [Peniophora sp. CONT]